MANWDQRFRPELIVSELDSKTRINKKGQFETPSFATSNYFNVLSTMFVFGNETPNESKAPIVKRAFINAKKKGKTTKENLKGEIRKEELKFLDKDYETFILITTITIPENIVLTRIKWNNSVISFNKTIPKIFKASRSRMISELANSSVDIDSVGLKSVRVKVKARTVTEAGTKALEDLDVVRSLLNFQPNKNKSWNFSFREKKRINEITIGQYHTLHHSDGSTASDMYWYQIGYKNSPLTIKGSSFWDPTIKQFHLFRKLLLSNPLKTEIETALIQYVRALDEIDYHTAYLKVWIVLEKLTCESIKKGEKIKRAAKIYSNPEFVIEILKHLREFRNNVVHHNLTSVHIEDLLYQLKGLVEEYLIYVLKNKRKSKTLEELGEFLDLPFTREELLRQEKFNNQKLRHIKEAFNFRQMKR